MNQTIRETDTIYFDGHDWFMLDAVGEVRALALLPQAEASDADAASEHSSELLPLPQLPDEALPTTLILPAEQLLSRTLSLPLAHPRFIDREILAQELEETSDEAPEAWWLAWHAVSAQAAEAALRGMMFGMPEAWRQQLDAADGWSNLQRVIPDIWLRLNHMLGSASNDGLVAVCDADAAGLCFGLWHGGDCCWLGMRRLNGWSTDAHAALLEDLRRSLQSMAGGEAITQMVGRLPEPFATTLAVDAEWRGEAVVMDALPSRQLASLRCCTAPNDTADALNFRHGSWRPKSDWSTLQPWYRSMALAAAVALLWMGGMIWQNHRLQSEIDAAQQQVIAAFHRGLPQQQVIVDPLAQLRQAAGMGNTQASDASAVAWLKQIAAIGQVYQQTPWTIREITQRHGTITMAGEAKDIETMNKIREALQQHTGKHVTVQDTDLSGGNQVKFRMAWS